MKEELIQKKLRKYKYFDKLGNFQTAKIIKTLLLFNFVYISLFFIILVHFQFINFDESILVQILHYLYQFLKNDDSSILHYSSIFFVIYNIYKIVISFIMFLISRNQKKLSKLGLETYKFNYFYSFLTKSIVIQPFENEELELDFVKKMKEEIIQIFNLDKTKDVNIEAFKTDKIKISVSLDFPDLLEFDVQKLRKNYFYIGMSYNHENQLEDLYIPFSSILHTAILGTSGGGKTSFTNVILANIFYNNDTMSKLFFVDFKGGIASKPVLNIANKYDKVKDKIQICENSLQDLYNILTNITNINKKRMQILKENDEEKWDNKDYIYLIFDEFAEIANFETTSKEEKEIHKSILSMINSLFATSRSQNIRIIYIAQSYVKEASNINNAIKTNTATKFMFKTTQSTSISSVISIEDIEELGANPKFLMQGEALILDNNAVSSQKFKTAYITQKIDTYILNNILNLKVKNNFFENVFIKLVQLLIIFISILLLYFVLPHNQDFTKNGLKKENNKEINNEKF
jgi:hypothetical protein